MGRVSGVFLGDTPRRKDGYICSTVNFPNSGNKNLHIGVLHCWYDQIFALVFPLPCLQPTTSSFSVEASHKLAEVRPPPACNPSVGAAKIGTNTSGRKKLAQMKFTGCIPWPAPSSCVGGAPTQRGSEHIHLAKNLSEGKVRTYFG